MAGATSGGFWYGDQSTAGRGVDVPAAMRDYRSAQVAVRKRSRKSMRMGETDLTAIRALLQARGNGRAMGPMELAAKIGISSASTTMLVDRLAASGQVERLPHSSDRRSILLRPVRRPSPPPPVV